MIKVVQETDRLCHCCIGQPALKVVYTKYGADVVLCKSCAFILAAQLNAVLVDGWEEDHTDETSTA